MKTLILLILLLAGGFAFWTFNENGMPTLPSFSSEQSNNASGTITHTVIKGDTLHSISRKHNTTVASIQKLNKLSDNTILIGSKLTIQPGQKTAPAPTAALLSIPPKPKSTPTKAKQAPPKSKTIARKNLPKSTVMESSTIAIDINAKNQVYLKTSNGKFSPAGTIIYGSDADANGNEIKTITYRDLKGKETTLPGSADPESVIRLALKKKR